MPRLQPLLLLLTLLALAVPAGAVTIEWVPVRHPGNPDDDTGAGSVAYSYYISKYEVTNAQYAEFLNAVPPNGLGLHHFGMTNDFSNGGIRFDNANPTGSKYVVKAGFADKPVTYVSFFSALRFINWLNNGQGSGATETGAYTLLGGTRTPTNWQTVAREATATLFLPSEDEWYKAAYYDGAQNTYYNYPAGTDLATVCSAPTSTPNRGNLCPGAVGKVTEVGAYTGSPSPYGAFDMAGNVFEWNEATVATSFRQLRGGTWGGFLSLAESSFYSSDDPRFGEQAYSGFRVASLVPEPGTGLLVAGGLLGLSGLRRRRRFYGRSRPAGRRRSGLLA